MDARYFSDKVVKWYELNKRSLPWRETKDPYRIWLSEIILQQTRVNQGLPYYLKFVEKFPTVASLAAAPEQQVLRFWQGLGYYTRARNMHKCAKEIVTHHGGVFPGHFESLKKLSGIGDYTAAAIASISFGQRTAVVDGNVFRVLSRVYGIETNISGPEGRKVFVKLANDLLANSPGAHNQALMEFGALHCTPRNPGCGECIFTTSCFARRHGLQQALPVKAKQKPVRRRYFYYLVFEKGRSLLMRKREQKDIWHGLYDFFLIERPRPSSVARLIEHANQVHHLNLKADSVDISAPYKHVLTHQLIVSKFIRVKEQVPAIRVKEPFRFYSSKKIAELPKPALISRFLTDNQLL